MMPSGHKAFLVQNPRDVELLLMHNRTYAAEYASTFLMHYFPREKVLELTCLRIGHAVSSRKRVEIVAKAKQLGVKVTNAKARVETES